MIWATRREMDALGRRVGSLDEHGTRGVGVVQVQLTEVVKDLAKLEGRLDAHQVLHEREARDRRAGRRWLVTAAAAVAAALAAVAGVLAELAARLR